MLCVCVWWTCMSAYDRIENKVIMIVENEKSWKRAKAWEWIVFHEVLQFRIHIVGRTIDERVRVCVFLCIEHGIEMWNLDIFGWNFFKHFWVYNRICVCLWLCVCTSVHNVCGRNDWQENMQNQEPNILYTQKEGQKHTHIYTCNAYSSPHTQSIHSVPSRREMEKMLIGIIFYVYHGAQCRSIDKHNVCYLAENGRLFNLLLI